MKRLAASHCPLLQQGLLSRNSLPSPSWLHGRLDSCQPTHWISELSFPESVHPVSRLYDPIITSANDPQPVHAGKNMTKRLQQCRTGPSIHPPPTGGAFSGTSLHLEVLSFQNPSHSCLQEPASVCRASAARCPGAAPPTRYSPGFDAQEKEGEPAKGMKPESMRLCPCLLHFQDCRGPGSCDVESRERRGKTETMGAARRGALGATWKPQEARPRR